MENKNIVNELEGIAAALYSVRLPVQEASAYSTVLTSANKIARLVKEMKEGEAHDGNNQPE